MGGLPKFGLNICCFPNSLLSTSAPSEILEGASKVLNLAGAVTLGGHTVVSKELRFGLCVVGECSPDSILSTQKARPKDHLILTKSLGTGAMITAYRSSQLKEETFQKVLRELEISNLNASIAAVQMGAQSATDVSGFGLLGHSSSLAQASGVGIKIELDKVPRFKDFDNCHALGIKTSLTEANKKPPNIDIIYNRKIFNRDENLLADPQTSGGLLISISSKKSEALLKKIKETSTSASIIGEVLSGPPRIEIN